MLISGAKEGRSIGRLEAFLLNLVQTAFFFFPLSTFFTGDIMMIRHDHDHHVEDDVLRIAQFIVPTSYL